MLVLLLLLLVLLLQSLLSFSPPRTRSCVFAVLASEHWRDAYYPAGACMEGLVQEKSMCSLPLRFSKTNIAQVQ